MALELAFGVNEVGVWLGSCLTINGMQGWGCITTLNVDIISIKSLDV